MRLNFAKVGLQPVLLRVPLGGYPQIADHRVDVVLEIGHLAARLDLNGARHIALRDRGCHFGDRAYLGRQVRGEQVYVGGQVAPRARGARNVGLAAEPTLDADLARHARDLIGKGRKRRRHAVDGVRQRRYLALRLHGQPLTELAIGHRGHYLDDAAHLVGQVVRHRVDVVGGYRGRIGVEAFSRSILPSPVGDFLAIWREPYTDGRALAAEAIDIIRRAEAAAGSPDGAAS